MTVIHSFSLSPHPGQAHPAGIRIDVDLHAYRPAETRLEYRITDPRALLRMPPPAAAGCADGLWQHSCCELFWANGTADAYTEFNFSPSGQWAIYAFDSYRQRAPGSEPPAWQPDIRFVSAGSEHQLSVTLPHAQISSTDVIAISCVLETHHGELSYWALRHATERPDFHHRGGFVPVPSPDNKV